MIKSAAGIIAIENRGKQSSFLLDVEKHMNGLYVKISETDWPAMVQRSLIFGE